MNDLTPFSLTLAEIQEHFSQAVAPLPQIKPQTELARLWREAVAGQEALSPTLYAFGTEEQIATAEDRASEARRALADFLFDKHGLTTREQKGCPL